MVQSFNWKDTALSTMQSVVQDGSSLEGLWCTRHLRDDGQSEASGNKTETVPVSTWYAVDLKSGKDNFYSKIWDTV